MDIYYLHVWLQGVVLTPQEAACLEPLAPPPLQRLLDCASSQPPAIKMGTSLKILVSSSSLSITVASTTLSHTMSSINTLLCDDNNEL